MEIIPVVYHSEPEGWWADSPKIPEWTAAASGLDELRRLVEEGVRFALERDDVLVAHYLLGYGRAAQADLVFDFVNGQTIVNQGPHATPAAHLTPVA